MTGALEHEDVMKVREYDHLLYGPLAATEGHAPVHAGDGHLVAVLAHHDLVHHHRPCPCADEHKVLCTGGRVRGGESS